VRKIARRADAGRARPGCRERLPSSLGHAGDRTTGKPVEEGAAADRVLALGLGRTATSVSRRKAAGTGPS
jgi:hypothetical protein